MLLASWRVYGAFASLPNATPGAVQGVAGKRAVHRPVAYNTARAPNCLCARHEINNAGRRLMTLRRHRGAQRLLDDFEATATTSEQPPTATYKPVSRTPGAAT